MTHQLDLTPDATSLNEWATNVNGTAVEDNDDGLVSQVMNTLGVLLSMQDLQVTT